MWEICQSAGVEATGTMVDAAWNNRTIFEFLEIDENWTRLTRHCAYSDCYFN